MQPPQTDTINASPASARRRHVVVALESACNGWGTGGESHQATANAVRLLLDPLSDELTLVSVKNRIPGPSRMMPAVPMPDKDIFCPADIQADEDARVRELIDKAAHSSIFNNYHPSVHVLDPVGGVREALVSFCKEREVDLLLLGPIREASGTMGALLRSLIGFGSVSEYMLHHLDVPIAVFHETEVGLSLGPTRKVLVCVDSLDDGGSARGVVKWVVDNITPHGHRQEEIEIHIVSCALRAPYDIVEGECACAIGILHQEEAARDREMRRLAEEAVCSAKGFAVGLGVRESDLVTDVLEADGEVAGAVVSAVGRYAQRRGPFDVVALGKRADCGGVSRTLRHWLGDGSVSDGLSKALRDQGSIVIVPTGG